MTEAAATQSAATQSAAMGPTATAPWRSLEQRDAREAELEQLRTSPALGDELGGRASPSERLKDAFPHEAMFPRKGIDELVVEPTDRRNFLGIMGASMALAGVSLSGCLRKPRERILPYTRRPEDLIPGKPRYFATAAQVTGSVIGLLVESQDGRPTKIEGNPRHPNSLGATDLFTQAAVLDLYDPNRIDKPLVGGKKLPFSHIEKKLGRLIAGLGKGRGLAVLVPDTRSPMLLHLLEEFEKTYPEALLCKSDAAYPRNTIAGLEMLDQKGTRPLYEVGRADRILSLDMDFLGLEGDVVRQARHFAWRRRISSPRDSMNRLYVVEPTFSITGANADHRLRLATSQVGEFLADLLGYMATTGINGPKGTAGLLAQLAASYKRLRPNYQGWLKPLARDLLAHRRRALVLVGERQPARVHALGHVLNAILEAHNRTVTLMPSPDIRSGTLEQLARAMASKHVTTLINLAGNPVYDAPADLDFGTLLANVPNSVTLSHSSDETTRACKWVVPKSHWLETWGELRATDGTLTIQQPLIAPLYPSISEIELLARLVERKERTGYELVRARWAAKMKNPEHLRVTWRRVLHDGARRVRARAKKPTFKWNDLAGAWGRRLAAPTKDALELAYCLDATVYDGRFGQNAWLQELPDPITKLTWDNALLVGIATARELGLKSQQIVTLEVEGRKLSLPVWVQPGVADYTLALPLGYGRTHSGKVAENAGFNAASLRSSKQPNFARGVTVAAARGSYALASTQEHGTMVPPGGKPRAIAVESTLASYRDYERKRKRHEPNFAKKQAQRMPDDEIKSIYQESNTTTGQQWGMSIDLTTCIGCNACTIACQAENNIASVGKQEVLNGRELHWIRLDRYFQSRRYDDEGEPAIDDVTVINQPLGCQQCETAPCENVCPVGATAHSPEGLNDMAYNRCIGTRYCGNNCPYKVRRFNFFNYTKRQDETHPLLAMQRNPDVTVRFRGVMEKCSYCVQRITAAKINAKVKGNGVVPDGAIVPACQQVCPTQAIIFGDVANPASSVSKMKKLTRDYALLADLNTRPRTTYLAKIRNPNPELV